MLDSRKWLLVLAMVLTAATASGQLLPNAAFQCVANAGVPPIVRAEGLAELVGDIVLNCAGGVQTTAGLAVPQVNVQIFLNTNVTSRLLADPYTEAMLMVDEPAAAAQNLCAAPPCTLLATADPAAQYRGTNVNVFPGRTNGANSIVWLGVPIDAPGTTFTRVIRITNVRANANQLGVSSTLVPQPIVAYISATGTTSIPINNPQQTVAYIQTGLSFSRRLLNGDSGFYEFSQCVSNNADLSTDPTKSYCPNFLLRYAEGFASSFKPRGGATAQNVPGAIYNNETGFYNPAFTATNNYNTAGLATQGTRLRAVFNNVPNGVRLYVGLGSITSSGSAGGTVVALTNTAADGSGSFSATPKSATSPSSGCYASAQQSIDYAEVILFGGSGTAVWEVTAADPLAIGRADIPVWLAWKANTASNLPAPGTSTVNGSFAPISTVTTASAIAPVPRFADTSSALTSFTIAICRTNLLFPFVSNQGGFDTGMVIANTSKDIFGTPNQSGTCMLNYYGDTNGGAAPPAQTSGAVPAGDYLAFTLSGGGKFGVTATPGFQGYIIASCGFQYAHGFAFISDAGASRLSHGYLALVLGYDTTTNNCTTAYGCRNTTTEVKGN